MSIKVLVIDHSYAMCKLLTELISSAADICVIGTAQNAHAANEMIKSMNPDVLTFDMQTSQIDGVTFLEQLMRWRPMPVLIISSLVERGPNLILRALELGAIDCIDKPWVESQQGADAYVQELLEKIRAANGARLRGHFLSGMGEVGAMGAMGATIMPSSVKSRFLTKQATAGGKIIFVGASTGGTEAVKTFLMGIPADCPPILIVQHMPETFTASFAARLDSICQPHIVEAQGGERLAPGTVYIAPGHSHLRIRRDGDGYETELLQTPPVNRHRPSVDVLFDSAAQLVGGEAIGVILTGMGKDGAQGLLRMRQAGGRTFGQDEASCVVYGMPREAAQIGAVEVVASLCDLAPGVLAAVSREQWHNS